MKVVIVSLLLCLSLYVFPLVQAQECSASVLCSGGRCCSQWGWCGTTTDHCGTGCLSGCPSTGPQCSASKLCPNSQCCSQYGWCGTSTDHCGTGCLSQCGSASTTKSATTATATTKSSTTTTTGGSTTGGSCKLSQIFSQNDFNVLFPNANHGARNGVANQHAIFTYSNLITAAETYYPAFGCRGTVEQRKRELAAFLAQTSQETSGWWANQPYVWGYVYSTEIGCTNTNANCRYCRTNAGDPVCAAGKGYFGRGAIQISWNYNYNAVSYAVFGDNRLLNDPDQLFTNGVTAFRTSLWFWMTAQSPKPSCHAVMTGQWTPSSSDVSLGRLAGFGMTTNIINGGLECQQPTPQKVTNRVGYFTRYVQHFGISDGGNVFCNNMRNYA